jgi:hypothetical protein
MLKYLYKNFAFKIINFISLTTYSRGVAYLHNTVTNDWVGEKGDVWW